MRHLPPVLLLLLSACDADDPSSLSDLNRGELSVQDARVRDEFLAELSLDSAALPEQGAADIQSLELPLIDAQLQDLSLDSVVSLDQESGDIELPQLDAQLQDLAQIDTQLQDISLVDIQLQDLPSADTLPTPELLPLSPEALNAELEDKDFLLINVHVPYAGQVPMTDIHISYTEPEAIAAYVGPLDTSTVIYCLTNHMARIAGEALLERGYQRIRYLDGGMRAWEAAGFNIERE